MRRKHQISLLAVLVVGLQSGCGIISGHSDPVESAGTVPSKLAKSSAEVQDASCADVPLNAASQPNLEMMRNRPVGSAIANNIGFSILASSLNQAKLTASLDAESELTFFAPTNAAFAKMPRDQFFAAVDSPSKMARLLNGHAVAKRLSVHDMPGTHVTLAGTKITISTKAGAATVDNRAHIICSGIQTRNATVYVIDAVLLAP